MHVCASQLECSACQRTVLIDYTCRRSKGFVDQGPERNRNIVAPDQPRSSSVANRHQGSPAAHQAFSAGAQGRACSRVLLMSCQQQLGQQCLKSPLASCIPYSCVVHTCQQARPAAYAAVPGPRFEHIHYTWPTIFKANLGQQDAQVGSTMLGKLTLSSPPCWLRAKPRRLSSSLSARMPPLTTAER